jgi:tripartite-type tricarboxylate transporter receptor subunit TctC
VQETSKVEPKEVEKVWLKREDFGLVWVPPDSPMGTLDRLVAYMANSSASGFSAIIHVTV